VYRALRLLRLQPNQAGAARAALSTNDNPVMAVARPRRRGAIKISATEAAALAAGSHVDCRLGAPQKTGYYSSKHLERKFEVRHRGLCSRRR